MLRLSSLNGSTADELALLFGAALTQAHPQQSFNALMPVTAAGIVHHLLTVQPDLQVTSTSTMTARAHGMHREFMFMFHATVTAPPHDHLPACLTD